MINPGLGPDILSIERLFSINPNLKMTIAASDIHPELYSGITISLSTVITQDPFRVYTISLSTSFSFVTPMKIGKL
jgi:hypothetical protein